jgi:3-oxoacyl-(acyl-carrier-protein) synthase
VYVTGMGAVCCLGVGVEALWRGLCEGRCGIGPLTRFDLEGLPYAVAGQVRDFELEPFAECGLSAGAQFALAAAQMAVEGLPEGRRAGLALVTATNFGPADVIESELAGVLLPDEVASYSLERGPFAEDAQRVAERLGAGGVVACISLSCASGNAAIAHALELVRTGRAEVALACGYDSIQRLSWAGLSSLRVMALPSDGEPALVRPFDRDRNGTVFSEGAGCLLIESARSAAERGAEPLAEVAGAAVNNNAHHLTHADPAGGGTEAVLRAALRQAEVPPEEVDHLSAHGTGTRLNDEIEARAVRSLLGERTGTVPVVALKGALGHAMGAAGALEAIGGVLTLREGVVPPTLHHRAPDPQCELDVVHGGPRQVEAEVVVSNSAGIGGCNAAVVLKRAPASAGAQ